MLQFDFTGKDTLTDEMIRVWKTGFFASWMLLTLSE
jgi:hypothetical protein